MPGLVDLSDFAAEADGVAKIVLESIQELLLKLALQMTRADHALIAKKRGDYNRFGFAVQLCTVRYLGTFLDDPLAVPTPVIHTLAKQLGVEAVDGLRAYSVGEQRWQHAAEIRTRYGYVEITERQVGFRLTRWLYSLCWAGTDRPSALFGVSSRNGKNRTLRIFIGTQRPEY